MNLCRVIYRVMCNKILSFGILDETVKPGDVI
jgi:hypothetical protein